MIDKEKLLEVKNNLEAQAECYERVLEKTKHDRNHNELLLTLVNYELRAMEEVEKEAYVPWHEQVAAGDKAFDEKQKQDKEYESVKVYPSKENVQKLDEVRVLKRPGGYNAVTTKIKEGKELEQSEVNSLFKPCYEIECAITDILTKHKTLKLKDIVYFVEQRELDFESKHIYGYVQSVLNRSERFEKVSYGNWRLTKEDGEAGATSETKPDSTDEGDTIAESTVLSVVRPRWNGVISYVDKLGVVNKIQQK